MFESQLKRLGLIQTYEFKFAIEISVFRKMLATNLEDSPIGGIADSVDHFEKSKYMYKGIVGDHSFRIKRMNTCSSRNSTLITGTLFAEDNETHVDAEFNNARTSRIGIWLAILFLLFWIMYAIENENYGSILYVGIVGVIVVKAWVLASKRRIKEMITQFEWDMLYLIGKQKKRS